MTSVVSDPAAEPSDGPGAFAIRPWHVVCLALIVLLGAALRFHHISATSVWCDELLSIHISNAHDFAVDRLPRDELITDVPDLMSLHAARPVWRLWSRMSGDVHPPLYYVTLRLWREVFGDTPLGLRSLSAIAGTLAILAAAAAGREIGGTAAGLWVALLNALASQHIYYGQEARMYALALLWTSLAIAIALRIGRLGFMWRRGVALAVFSLAAMLTLYLSSASLLAVALYVLIVLRGRDRWRTIVSLVAAGVAFAICWLPFMLGQSFHGARTADWLQGDPNGHTLATLLRALTMPMTQFGVPLQNSRVYAYTFASIFVLPAFFVRRCPALTLPWLATVLAVAMPATADVIYTTNMLEWPRYTLTLILPASIAIVIMARVVKPRWARVAVPASLALFSALSLAVIYDVQRYDYRGVSNFAESSLRETGGRVVFASTWNAKFNSVLLLSAQYFWQSPPHDVVMIESPAELERLPRAMIGDHVVLIAGDRAADLGDFPSFAVSGKSTWALGVGSVMTLTRREASATTRATP